MDIDVCRPACSLFTIAGLEGRGRRVRVKPKKWRKRELELRTWTYGATVPREESEPNV